ncbi:MAG: hypothetical protein D6732_17745 [Methanobacteriota archaeon]|nr:MAG: hypothetical protein D6732_17745 [Euryarchaeota archaeon]
MMNGCRKCGQKGSPIRACAKALNWPLPVLPSRRAVFWLCPCPNGQEAGSFPCCGVIPCRGGLLIGARGRPRRGVGRQGLRFAPEADRLRAAAGGCLRQGHFPLFGGSGKGKARCFCFGWQVSHAQPRLQRMRLRRDEATANLPAVAWVYCGETANTPHR